MSSCKSSRSYQVKKSTYLVKTPAINIYGTVDFNDLNDYFIVVVYGKVHDEIIITIYGEVPIYY